MSLGPSAATDFCEPVLLGIVEDSIVELNETLQVQLSSSDPALLDLFSSADISIIDDDSECNNIS